MFSAPRELPAITLELPAITDEPEEKRRGPLSRALLNPVYRSGYALVINTAGSTAIGVAYWAIAARMYTSAEVGLSSALTSALILLSSLAQLNLSNALPRFLPQAGRRAGRLIAYSYGASAVVGVVAAAGFVLVMPRLSSKWAILAKSPSLSLMFVGAALIWGIFALEDAALTGLHQAVVVPVENATYGVLKLALLVAVAATLPTTGIFVSWVVPLVVVIPAINWLIFRRYARTGPFATKHSSVTAHEIARFASVDYIGGLLTQAYGGMLPLLVMSALGSNANGSFYIAWTITAGLSLVPANFGTSLMVEAARAPQRLAELTRGVLLRSVAVTSVGAIVLVALARPILSIYGSAYTHATTLLAILAVATLPRMAVQLTWSLDRIAGRVGRAALTQLALGVLVIGGSSLLIHRMGTEGVGIAWTASNVLVAIVRLPTIAGAIRRRRTQVGQRRAGAEHRGVRRGGRQSPGESGRHGEPSVLGQRTAVVLREPTVRARGRRARGRHRAASR